MARKKKIKCLWLNSLLSQKNTSNESIISKCIYLFAPADQLVTYKWHFYKTNHISENEQCILHTQNLENSRDLSNLTIHVHCTWHKPNSVTMELSILVQRSMNHNLEQTDSFDICTGEYELKFWAQGYFWHLSLPTRLSIFCKWSQSLSCHTNRTSLLFPGQVVICGYCTLCVCVTIIHWCVGLYFAATSKD